MSIELAKLERFRFASVEVDCGEVEDLFDGRKADCRLKTIEDEAAGIRVQGRRHGIETDEEECKEEVE